MNIKTEFDLFEYVIIKALDYKGRIIEISISDFDNKFYKINYWWSGELRTVCLKEDEILKIKKTGE
jgi:hypothetical protein